MKWGKGPRNRRTITVAKEKLLEHHLTRGDKVERHQNGSPIGSITDEEM